MPRKGQFRTAAAKRREMSRLPSREEVLAFVADHPGRGGKRNIARAFGVTGSARKALGNMLKTLADDGSIESQTRPATKHAIDLPPVTVLEITGRDQDGELTANPVDWPDESGSPPTVAVIVRRSARGRAVPGVGDRILARLKRNRGNNGARYNGEILKILQAPPRRILGVVRRRPGGAQIEPVDRRQKALILEPDTSDAREGDLVTVSPSGDGRHHHSRARITEIVGSMTDQKAVSLIALETHGIPYVFSEPALAEAEAARPAALKGRKDWRHLPLVTIDPVDARDHDDAVYAEPDPDPANPNGHIVIVAIADVAHYVPPGSALDRSALERGNSVYFPDRVVPMLPERISNDLCSLRENVDRPAIAVRMIFTADGRRKSHCFKRIMMRSAASLSYQGAQAAFDGKSRDLPPGIADALDDLRAAYKCLARERDERAPLDLDLPERKIILGQAGHIERVVIPPRLEAHRLIEELMIQANVAAAETLESRDSPIVYRIHDNPSMAKLEALREFLKSIELSLPKAGNLRPAHFNSVLGRVRDTEHSALVNEVVLRSQSQAEYSPQNIGHFGLNLRRYAHFTSPIRRYADLIVHRAIIRALNLGRDGITDVAVADLPETAARISVAERRAMAAERDTIDRLVAHWLAASIGATFAGRIAGVTGAGLFVKLDETGADGFVPLSSLGSDYFRFDESRHSVTGERTGETHRLGDAVEVRLVEAVPLSGSLRFEMLSSGRILEAKKRRPRPQTVGGKRHGRGRSRRRAV